MLKDAHMDKRNKREFAVTLRNWREKNELSMMQLAVKVGVSLQTVYRWERGDNLPSKLAAEKFRTLGIPA